MLEDEWLLTVERRGWRLPPDVLVGLLAASPHRRRPAGPRRAASAGRSCRGCSSTSPSWPARPVPHGRPRPDDVGLDGLPGLAVRPSCWRSSTAAPGAVAAAVAHGFRGGTYTLAHRNVLVNFVARCRADALALAEAWPRPGVGHGARHSLADLADTAA